jgi:hypothetical protein
VARLVEASHAVHRAVIALGAEPVIAGRSSAGPTEEKHVLPAALPHGRRGQDAATM